MNHENTSLKNSFALSEVQKYLQNQKRLYLRLRFDITQMVAGALVNPLPQKKVISPLALRYNPNGCGSPCESAPTKKVISPLTLRYNPNGCGSRI